MTERKRFLLRLDPEVHDAVQAWARDDLRSVNGQIEFILRRALRDAGRLPRPKRDRPGSTATDPAAPAKD
jgi:hypothetical protein